MMTYSTSFCWCKHVCQLCPSVAAEGQEIMMLHLIIERRWDRDRWPHVSVTLARVEDISPAKKQTFCQFFFVCESGTESTINLINMLIKLRLYIYFPFTYKWSNGSLTANFPIGTENRHQSQRTLTYFSVYNWNILIKMYIHYQYGFSL